MKEITRVPVFLKHSVVHKKRHREEEQGI